MGLLLIATNGSYNGLIIMGPQCEGSHIGLLLLYTVFIKLLGPYDNQNLLKNKPLQQVLGIAITICSTWPFKIEGRNEENICLLRYIKYELKSHIKYVDMLNNI
jgi:hypothetical protein